jgi:hypothetical protein
MKVITLHPLWAVLLVHALKRNETRSWEIKYRGPLLIHASKTIDPEQMTLCSEEPFKSALASIGIMNWQQLPLGKIIGQMEVTSCAKVVEFKGGRQLLHSDGRITPLPGGYEVMFGDYSLGRYITLGQNHQVLTNPFPIAGQQRIWELSLEMFNNLSVGIAV